MVKQLVPLILSVILLVGCSNEKNTNNLNDSKSIDNVFTLKNVTPRNGQSPNFEWANNSGNANNFKSFHSKLTIINFWATWCGPCRKELPDLVAISNEFATKGVRVIGISTDRGSNVVADVSEFINKNKVTYPIVIDNGELAKAFGNVRGIPTTFLVNEEGKVVESFMGLRTKEFFVEKINRLLQ
ncbi:MAG: TlpA disulfide reductase family protein [Bacteroidota bacterium]